MSISIGAAYTSGSAGSVQYSGLTSDTNWVDFVDKLMETERFTINQLNDWKQEWSDKITALQGLESRLNILESTSGDFNSESEFYSRTSSSSNEDVLTVTNTSSATPGAHSVTVGTNIPHRLGSQGWADENTTAVGDGGGDFIISVGAQGTITIADADITAATTLQDLRDLINNDSENTGAKAVTASIVNDGSGSNQYRLVITAGNGGPNYKISINKNPSKLNFYQNDISPADTTNLTATTTTGVTTMGSFTEDKSVIGSAAYRTYTFTGPAGNETVGSGGWTINWSGDNGGGSGSINLGSSYTPGDTIEVEDGVFIKFDAGVLEGGSKTFTVKAYGTDIDNPEMDTWNGTSSVSSDGNYMSSTNKTFNFTISGSGTKTIGTDSFDLTWTDGEGNSGTINVTPSNYANLSVYQGVKISFGAGTTEGGDTFSIDVHNSTIQDGISSGLAQAEIETHSGFVDEDTSFVTTAAGTFSYTYGGVSQTVSVAANSTLADLRNSINNDTNNPGVTAAIVNDGSGLSTACHLQLIGNNSGAAYKFEGIEHTLNNFSKDGTTGYGFTQTQAAQNAMIKVDGYPTDASEYIQRDSNTIGDLISGVTINLKTTGTSIVSITNDTSAIKTKIGDFVDSINYLLDYSKEMTAYDETGKGENNGIMIGNYAFQIVQHRINDILSSPVPGLTDGIDSYTHLSQIGIKTDPDQGGKWVIDDSTLDAALNSNLDGVCKLFARNESTDIDGTAELIRDETDNLTKSYLEENPGIVSVVINNYSEIIDNIDSKIEREERRLAIVENRLNIKFSNLDTLLGQLQGQSDYISNLLDTLPSIGGK